LVSLLVIEVGCGNRRSSPSTSSVVQWVIILQKSGRNELHELCK
jgi:hypothetical protein